jgi:hypothetical protein
MVNIFCIKSTCFYEQKDLLCRQEERNQKYSTEYGVTFDSLLVHLVSHKKNLNIYVILMVLVPILELPFLEWPILEWPILEGPFLE